MTTEPNPPSPSRRAFLTGSAAALGASSLLGGEAWASIAALPRRQAAERAPLADGDPIKIGVIGTGGMGTAHCAAFCDAVNKAGREQVQVVAVSDVCQTHLDKAHGVCTEKQPGVEVTKHRYYKDLLKRADLHGVVIASPEHWHADHSIDAILAGKDVYCEKPMTLRLPDSMRLRKVCMDNPDMVLQVGTQMIQLPKYRAAKELIADGAIGHPTFSQTSYCRNSKDGEWLYYAIDPKVQPGEVLDWDAWCGPMGRRVFDTNVFHRWRRYRDWSTGIIGDLLVHVLTPLVMAVDAGWPVRVTATGGHYVDKAMENHDQVNLTIQFERDHTMIVAGSTCNDIGLETMVRGHKATMYLGGNNVRVLPQPIFVDDVDEQNVELENIGNDQDAHRVAWLKSIRTREKPEADIELSTMIMVIVDLATRSMWEGQAFHFDPEQMRAYRV